MATRLDVTRLFAFRKIGCNKAFGVPSREIEGGRSPGPSGQQIRNGGDQVDGCMPRVVVPCLSFCCFRTIRFSKRGKLGTCLGDLAISYIEVNLIVAASFTFTSMVIL